MSVEAVAVPGPGDVVGEGRFELGPQLGEGGMSTVFVAHDHFLDRDVALKLLIPRYLGRPEREQRFLNEAEYLRRVQDHARVAQFIDAGRLRDRNRWPWLSTEIMSGRTLDWLVIRRELDTAKIVDIARQLAEALSACHEAGVVHRDITPSNVFVLDDGSLKLFDFSHAADLRGPRVAVGAPERLTGFYETPGTVGYIGPEQAANAVPDASMDTFGFGVLLYELVSGRNPYERFTDRDAFIQAQCDGTLEVPRLHAWAYDAPEELAELVRDCMQRDSTQRPRMPDILARIDAIAEKLSQLREAAISSASKGGTAFARPPELRPMDRGESERLDPEESPAASAPKSIDPAPTEPAPAEPAPIGPSRARIVALIVGLGFIVIFLSLIAHATFFGAEDLEKIDHGRDQSLGSSHDPDRTAEHDGAPPEAETGADDAGVVAETGGMEIVPEPVEPEPKNGKPKNGKPKNGKPKNGKPKNGKPEQPAKDPDCEGVEADARAANTDGDWKRVIELTARKACWTSQTERIRMRVNALSITGRIEECIKAGAGSKDPKVTAIVDLCKEVMDASTPKAP